MRIRKRRIVERPRLYALLDQSKAPVRMLIAPAGYGKTTLAEQWVVRDGRDGVWYTARSASTDVAALALGIARSAKSIFPDCDVRLRAHLRALPAPAENVETLAELLGEDLMDWPADTWLVLDDYHEVAEEPRAEDFVKTLVAVAPLNVLIASRVRPSWITTKELLYGAAFEVSQNALAMDNAEAADVLIDRSGPSASSLVSLANGWPAVIGLASVSSAEVTRSEQLPDSLYRFFAEEVFAELGREVRDGLTTLAIAPILDRRLAVELLGADVADRVCSTAIDVGLLEERGQRLDLHPLARAFLDERSVQLGLVPALDSAQACLASYRRRREWDAALELLFRTRVEDEIEKVVHEALDDLLGTARLSTIEKWCELAEQVGLSTPTISLARAEVALRCGKHLEAVSRAQAAAADRALEFRALTVGGRAAHLASREEEALALYVQAEGVASTESQVRDAKWGQLMCAIDLELPTAAETLADLSAGVRFADAREVVRAAAHGVYLQSRQGRLDLDEADVAQQVLAAANDPIVESSFLSGYTIALGLVARYEEGLEAARALRRTADQFRFDFAIAYSLCGEAIAHAGFRRWADAERAASQALALAREAHDVHANLLSSSILLRLYAQRNDMSAGIRLQIGPLRGAVRGSVAEVVCSRALVFACAGRAAEALDMMAEVCGTSSAVEPVVLEHAVEAVCAVRSGGRNVVDAATLLESVAFETGAVDLLVTTYRACPELLTILLRSAQGRRFKELVSRVGDSDLADLAGFPVGFDDPRVLLSKRERDVYDLLSTGLTNREIGRLLFIEESTVKAHTHRIYDKLGVRSRSAISVQASLERSGQATSATDATSDADPPSVL